MSLQPHFSKFLISLSLFLLSVLPVVVHGACDAEEPDAAGNKAKALKFKIGAIASVLVSGGIGVCIPILSKLFPACQPGKNFFFMIKAFAAGVILATGFIHVLPDATELLTSPCLKENPWSKFPFAQLFAMVAAILIFAIETVATKYFKDHAGKATTKGEAADEEKPVDIHTHATHGHAHGSVVETEEAKLLRHRIISQVLEMGIIVHSVIIGLSLGASQNPSTIKTLLVALSFHQLFEGMGLGGCISEAKYKTRSVVVMALFFALTTPVGIALGIGVSKVYDQNSPKALIIEGVLNSASAGILIYMALVDLLAADFMNERVQISIKLLLVVLGCLVLGAGLMSLLAIWA